MKITSLSGEFSSPPFQIRPRSLFLCHDYSTSRRTLRPFHHPRKHIACSDHAPHPTPFSLPDLSFMSLLAPLQLFLGFYNSTGTLRGTIFGIDYRHNPTTPSTTDLYSLQQLQYRDICPAATAPMHTTAGADTRLRVRRFPLLRLTQICFKFKPSRPELASQCASESESLNFQISCFARYKKLTASTARSEEAVARTICIMPCPSLYWVYGTHTRWPWYNTTEIFKNLVQKQCEPFLEVPDGNWGRGDGLIQFCHHRHAL